MNQLTTITNDASQQVSVALEDGSVLTVSLTYRPAIQRWTLDLSHPKFKLNGVMLGAHPNLLRSWRRLLTFGLACTTTDGADPVTVEDFSSGRAQLYVLSAAEVAQVETDLIGRPA